VRWHRTPSGDYTATIDDRTYTITRVEYPRDGTYWVVIYPDLSNGDPATTLREAQGWAAADAAESTTSKENQR
jgi:hypothetical protein